jgi:hypothetical protein
MRWPSISRTALVLLGVFVVVAWLLTEASPAGELRKVKILYRCSICGTEVRMTVANDQMPEPPRHCLEDMDLVTAVDDL